VTVERETKLDVGPAFRLPGFDGVRDDIRVVRAEPVRTRTVYWDTEDLRLARWGCSLRYRDGEGWTLKLPAEEQGGALARDEIVAQAPPAAPPERLVELVTAYVRGRALRPAVALRTVRTRVAFTGADRTPVGEVVDDEVAVLDGRRIAARFREVEVETHDEALAGAAIARLRAAGAGETVLTPKYLRALGRRALDPPELRASASLPVDALVRGVVENALAASVIRLLRADAAVRLDEDPEGVHRARVAVRRLRSDLRTFRSLLDRGWAAALRRELKWLGDALRGVRDLDVLSERLSTTAATLAPEDRPHGERLVRRVRAERSEARGRLLADLRSARYRILLERLVEAAASPGVRAEDATRAASEAMEPLMAGPWSHLARSCRGLGEDASDGDLHAARIRAKRARYAAEALAPLVGKPARRFAQAAEALQEVLGEHQDAVVAAAWLREAARAAPSTGLAAGLLVGREDLAREGARRRWRRAWKELRRTKKRSWP
jgi:CHAD domain-containing protein